MTTYLGRIAIPAVALALAVAGCGGSGERAATAGGGTPTVSVKNLAGFGAVLVDDHGHALYASDQEAGGKIRCTNGCTTFWDPLTAGASTPTAAPGVAGRLATIRRADGTRQVTLGDKPLYRFTEDPGPGQVTGDDFKDSFDGISFTWHAVTTKGTAAPAATPSQRSGY